MSYFALKLRSELVAPPDYCLLTFFEGFVKFCVVKWCKICGPIVDTSNSIDIS